LVGHPLGVEDQAGIEAEFSDSFEACRELHEFAEAHRPRRTRDDTPIIHWTLARSDRTFGMVVKLCRLGYGQQASMLNRSLFEDMISAHWAALRPASANRLMGWHEEYVRLRRAAMYEEHGIPYRGASPPVWSDLRKKRMKRLFGRGSWTARSLPRMVKEVETMWAEGEDRASLQRMHAFWHQGLNIVLHHSARSLNFGYSVADEGTVTFALGPSKAMVSFALGFAFWVYSNTVSLVVEGDDLVELHKLCARHEHVMPDAWLRHLIREAANEDEAGLP
jgi:hypothetical protein